MFNLIYFTFAVYYLFLIYTNNEFEMLSMLSVCSYFKIFDVRGRVDDLSFLDYICPFCFLSIEFHCTFSISCKILPYYVYYYCILIRMWYVVGTSFVRARCATFHTHASLLTIFVCFFFVCFFVLFRFCCSHTRVFWKTLVHEFPFTYSHNDFYSIFSLFWCKGN